LRPQGYKCANCRAIVHKNCRNGLGGCQTNLYKGHKGQRKPHPNGNHEPRQNSVSFIDSENGQITTNEPVLYRAAYDFPSENDRELELKQGDIVELFNADDDEWWYGQVMVQTANGLMESNRRGFFPATYVLRYTMN
jgi:hypothetical protein